MPDSEKTAAHLTARLRTAWDPQHAETIFRGGLVFLPTGEVAARDVAVVAGRIAAVGTDLVSGGADIVDVAGATLVPAYIEPHAHIFGPLSVASYLSAATPRGTGAIVSDDSFTYSFLDAAQHDTVLDVANRLPVRLLWSLRADLDARQLPVRTLLDAMDRPDVHQIGEILVRAALTDIDSDVADVLAAAHGRGLRIEGHAPGASIRTIGVAAAAGITADHEAMSGADVIERLRLGLWAHLRHNGVLPSVTTIVPELLAAGVSWERTTFTVDWSLPPWMATHGTIDAAIGAALEAGLPAEQAYLSATLRPASYLRIDEDLGAIAPGRLASINVLAGLGEPTPQRVFLAGQEVARDGVLIEAMPDVAWDKVDPPAWSPRTRGPSEDTFRLDGTEPSIVLVNASLLRPGDGGLSDPLCAVAIHPDTGMAARAAVYGWPGGLRALVSTLNPLRLLVAVGARSDALVRCVDAVIGAGGGIAFETAEGLRLLPLSVGGAISREPFGIISEFWGDAEEHLRSLGHGYPDPLATLLYMATASLPGARFTNAGVVDTKPGVVLSPPFMPTWR